MVMDQKKIMAEEMEGSDIFFSSIRWRGSSFIVLIEGIY